MFLVTTALEETWDPSRETLFLGQWCLLYPRPAVLDSLDYRVLPYPWDDRARMNQDAAEIMAVYDRQLSLWGDRLNALHGRDLPLGYWRLVIGPWLMQFVSIVHERHLCLTQAATSHAVDDTWILEPPADGLAPNDQLEFLGLFPYDAYNHQLYGAIIRRLGLFPHTLKPAPAPRSRPDPVPPTLTERCLALWSRTTRGRCRYLLQDSSLGVGREIRLQLALGQPPFPGLGRPRGPVLEIDPDLRGRLRGPLKMASPLDDLLGWLVPDHLPRIFVEGYAAARKLALDWYPPRARVILTSRSHLTDDYFNLFAAEQRLKGAKLALAQHGGHYGIGLLNHFEDHEKAVADRFFTWGWNDDPVRTRPAPAGKLLGLRRKVRPAPDGGILAAIATTPRYSYRLYSLPVGATQIESYLEEQARFIAALAPPARGLFRLRLYVSDFGLNQKQRFLDRFPDLRLADRRETLIEQLGQSRLFVCTYNSTTFIESFYADMPTVMFWNPALWELRPEAAPFFTALARAGVFHDTPEAAAAQVNAVCADPLSWWGSPPVREAVAAVREQFARTGEDWIGEWKRELRLLEDA